MAIVTYTSPSLGTSNPDSVPDSFSFATQTDVAIGTEIISEYITVTGTTLGAAISISGTNNPFYQIAGGNWTNTAGTIAPGQRVRVKHESSAFNGQSIISTLTIGGVQATFTSTTQAAAGADPYDLYATDTNSRGTIPFAVNWPIAPTTSATYEVPSELSFAAALGTSGAVFNVAAGNYGSFSPTGDNQEWNIDNAAFFSGFSIGGRSNLKISGGTFTRGGGDGNLGANCIDVQLDNCRFTSVGNNVIYAAVRLAFVQCTIETTDSTTGFLYHADFGGGNCFDIIIAGCHLISSGTNANASRIMAVTRNIFVDTRLQSVSSRPAIRSHQGSSDWWARRLMFADCGGPFMSPEIRNNDFGAKTQEGCYMGDHWMYDCESYTTSSSFGWQRRGMDVPSVPLATSWPGTFTLVGSRNYHPSASYGLMQSKAGDTFSDNQTFAAQAAPALGSWLTARNIAPGADH